jgi:hypothetical protein
LLVKIRMISVHGLVLLEYSYSKDFVQNWTYLSYIRPSLDSPPLVACYNVRSKSAFSHSIQMGSSSFDTNDAEMSYSCLQFRSFQCRKIIDYIRLVYEPVCFRRNISDFM